MTARGTGDRTTRLLGTAALVALAANAWIGLVVSPPDVVQGDLVRLIYVHPAAATTCYVGFGLCALASLAYLWPRTRSRRWDRLAGRVGRGGRGLLRRHPRHRIDLGPGLLGGVVDMGRPAHPHRPAPGRLRRLPGAAPDRRGSRRPGPPLAPWPRCCAPWSSRSTTRPPPGGRPSTRATPCSAPTRSIHGWQLVGMLVSFVAFGLLFAWLLVHRYRVEVLEDRFEDEGLALAIAERRAEGARPAPASPARRIGGSPKSRSGGSPQSRTGGPTVNAYVAGGWGAAAVILVLCTPGAPSVGAGCWLAACPTGRRRGAESTRLD